MGFKFKIRFFILLLLPVVLNACSSNKQDPLEPFNRSVYIFNDTLDKYALKPTAKVYYKFTPKLIKTGVDNFFNNFTYPLVAGNQFLQGKVKLGLQDTGRFLVNSTIGVLGLFDVAKEFGLEKHNEDFGQTFASWGVASGPYVVIPFIGPSTLRDSFGEVANYYSHPLNLEYFDEEKGLRNSLLSAGLINKRANLLNSEGLLSGDRYSFIRDAYLQTRVNLISDGESDMQEDDPFLDDEEE